MIIFLSLSHSLGQVIAFFGFAVISFACGLAFYVTFEGPAVTILNIIYEKLVEKTKYNDDYWSRVKSVTGALMTCYEILTVVEQPAMLQK